MVSPRKRWGIPEDQPGFDEEQKAWEHIYALEEALLNLGYEPEDVPAAEQALVDDLIENRDPDDIGYLSVLVSMHELVARRGAPQGRGIPSEMKLTEELVRAVQNIYDDEYEFTPIYNALDRFEEYLYASPGSPARVMERLQRLRRIRHNVSDWEDELVGRA